MLVWIEGLGLQARSFRQGCLHAAVNGHASELVPLVVGLSQPADIIGSCAGKVRGPRQAVGLS